MISKTIRIGGMTCVNCQSRIQAKLQSMAGVEAAAVSFETGTADIAFNEEVVSFARITSAIETLGYAVLDDSRQKQALRTAGVVVIILSLYVLMRNLGVSAFVSAFPLARAGMSYGMLFVIGLITSVHCIAMCGGINLSQTLQRAPAPSSPRGFLLPSILYNAGRVASYTAIGFLAGALGSVITVSGRFQGVVQLIAGVFMALMGINMLGIFPFLRRWMPRMPNSISKKFGAQRASGKGPLVIGLLNGLMPCGPLQAMQLYALSTGNPVMGALSMFLFSAGTVPLMFGIGAISSLLSGKAGARVMRAGAILITAMGLTMFSNGWSLGGFASPFGLLFAKTVSSPKTADGGVFVPVKQDGFQIVNSTLRPGQYPAITVQQGIPVRWTINAPQGSINGCNNRMLIREYGIEHRFTQGENVIEFLPERTGKFPYSCWMGMIRSSITVVAEGERAAVVQEPDLDPKPAGVSISCDDVARAAIAKDFQKVRQEVKINLTDNGITPAIVVVQRGVPALWTIANDSLDPGNASLIFPSYYQTIDMEQGNNTIEFTPESDFDFSTQDNVFYGYVKVVDNIENIDVDAIKDEVSEFETLIYPAAHFETGGGASCACCGA
jgi:sulfite exporter TauE/SafE/plastocyanin domain-containing protein